MENIVDILVDISGDRSVVITTRPLAPLTGEKPSYYINTFMCFMILAKTMRICELWPLS